MISTKPLLGSNLYSISVLLLTFSACRFWVAHYGPQEQPAPVEVEAPTVTPLPATPVPLAPQPQLAEQSPTFDISSLKGLNIEGIKSSLGEPITSKPSSQNEAWWELTYQRGNQRLLVRYNPRTKAVINFYLQAADSAGYTSYMRILKGGQFIDTFDRNYRFDWVCTYIPNSTLVRSYQGLTITPLAASASPPGKTLALTRRALSFDLPALVGLNMKQVKTKLGPSTNKYSPPTGSSTWMAIYYRHGEALFINYNPKTNLVSDFILTPRVSRDELTESALYSLMSRGNIHMQSNHYRVEWLANPRNPKYYEGIKIIPLRGEASKMQTT